MAIDCWQPKRRSALCPNEIIADMCLLDCCRSRLDPLETKERACTSRRSCHGERNSIAFPSIALYTQAVWTQRPAVYRFTLFTCCFDCQSFLFQQGDRAFRSSSVQTNDISYIDLVLCTMNRFLAEVASRRL